MIRHRGELAERWKLLGDRSLSCHFVSSVVVNCAQIRSDGVDHTITG
jgi:hypothetical protein